MKEKLLFSNEESKLFRIYKRLCRNPKGGSKIVKVKFIDIYYVDNVFEIRKVTWSGYTNSYNKEVVCRFWFTDKLNVSVPKAMVLNGQRYLNTNIAYAAFFNFLSECSKYTQRKINRIIKSLSGHKFKIGKPVAENIIRLFYQSSLELFERKMVDGFDGLFSKLKENWYFYRHVCPPMFALLVKSSLKKSLKAKLGFAGKKLVRDFIEWYDSGYIPSIYEGVGIKSPLVSELRVDDKLFLTIENLSVVKKCLTHGDVDLSAFRSSKNSFYVCVHKIPKDKHIQKFIKLVPHKMRRYVVAKNAMELLPFSYMADTLRMFKSCCDDQEVIDYITDSDHSLEMIHDFLAVHLRRRPDPKIEYKKYDFDGVSIGNYKLIVCPNSYTLRNWATYMSNCVYGYRDQMKDGKVLICALTKEDEIIYNLSLTPSRRENGVMKYSVRELNSRFNKGYDKSDYDLVVKELTKNGVINVQAEIK